MHQIVIDIMYTEGEDMNTLAARCHPLFRVGGSYFTAQESLFPPFTCFWFRCLNLDSVCPKESLSCPTRSHSSHPGLPLHQLCPAPSSHLGQLGCPGTGRSESLYKTPAKVLMPLTCVRPFQQTTAGMITFK